MQYTFRPNLFTSEETLTLEGTVLQLSRKGRLRNTIDLHSVTKLQEYSSGPYLDENHEHVRSQTCRVHHATGWPLLLRSTSYLSPSLKTTPVVEDHNEQFRAFRLKLLEQLASLNPDLPVEYGNRGYSWFFILAGIFTCLMFGGLGYFIVVNGNGDITMRMAAGPLMGVGGIVFGYFWCKLAMAYWPESRSVREVLSER